MSHTVDVLLETFTWVGFGTGAMLVLVWLVLLLVDGTWIAVDAVIEPGDRGRVAHWFTLDGGVGRAPLSSADEEHLTGADSARIHYREGTNRMRLTAHSPLVRLFGWAAVSFIALGALALVASFVLMLLG